MSTPEPALKDVRRAGGLSLIIFGLLSLVSLPLTFASISILSANSPLAAIQALPTLSSIYASFVGNFIALDLFGILAIVSLYFTLRGTSQLGALVALILGTVGLVIDLAADLPLRYTEIRIASEYSGATSDVQKGGLVAAYQFASDYSNVAFLMGVGVLLSLAFIAIGYTMLKDKNLFSSITAYLAFLSGISGLLVVLSFGIPAALIVIFFANTLLGVAFSLMAGRRLYRL